MVIIRGIYLPPQLGVLANNLLAQHVSNHGYCKVKQLPGLWKHEWRHISFRLVVEDVGIGYFGRDYASDECTQNLL